MAQEYKKRGGTYNTDKSDKDESQQNLSKWEREDWQTKEGEGEARQSDGSRKRYLPKKAWEQMDDKEKEATDEKKQQQSKQGQQFVANTGKARKARRDVTEEQDDENSEAPVKSKRSTRSKNKPLDEEATTGEDKASQGQKRSRNQQTGKDKEKAKESGKKPKTNDTSNAAKGKTLGSKHNKADPPAQQASVSRLPKKGQTAHWKAMPGWVDGKVVEILTKDETVEGKHVKAKRR